MTKYKSNNLLKNRIRFYRWQTRGKYETFTWQSPVIQGPPPLHGGAICQHYHTSSFPGLSWWQNVCESVSVDVFMVWTIIMLVLFMQRKSTHLINGQIKDFFRLFSFTLIKIYFVRENKINLLILTMDNYESEAYMSRCLEQRCLQPSHIGEWYPIIISYTNWKDQKDKKEILIYDGFILKHIRGSYVFSTLQLDNWSSQWPL